MDKLPLPISICSFKQKLFGLGMLALSFSAFAQLSQDSGDWPGLVNRCSQAAIIITKATEKHSDHHPARDAFIDYVYERLKESKQLGAQTPSETEIFLSKVSARTLLEAGTYPASSPQARDWFMSQIAATCALKASQLKPLDRAK